MTHEHAGAERLPARRNQLRCGRPPSVRPSGARPAAEVRMMPSGQRPSSADFSADAMVSSFVSSGSRPQEVESPESGQDGQVEPPPHLRPSIFSALSAMARTIRPKQLLADRRAGQRRRARSAPGELERNPPGERNRGRPPTSDPRAMPPSRNASISTRSASSGSLPSLAPDPDVVLETQPEKASR